MPLFPISVPDTLLGLKPLLFEFENQSLYQSLYNLSGPLYQSITSCTVLLLCRVGRLSCLFYLSPTRFPYWTTWSLFPLAHLITHCLQSFSVYQLLLLLLCGGLVRPSPTSLSGVALSPVLQPAATWFSIGSVSTISSTDHCSHPVLLKLEAAQVDYLL